MVSVAEQRAVQTDMDAEPNRFSVASLRSLYAATAELSEQERRARLKELVFEEFALPAEALRAATRARLEAFLQMEDILTRPAVDRIVNSLEAVMDEVSGVIAMRRVEMVQTIRHSFSNEEQQRLQRLVPGVLERRPVNALEAPRAARSGRRRWWRFLWP